MGTEDFQVQVSTPSLSTPSSAVSTPGSKVTTPSDTASQSSARSNRSLKDGRSVWGFFVENQLHGKGGRKGAGGFPIELGDFRNGELVNGKKIFKDGTVEISGLAGCFKNGKLHGEGVRKGPNGLPLEAGVFDEGAFKSGKKALENGIIETSNPYDPVKPGSFQGDQLTGRGMRQRWSKVESEGGHPVLSEVGYFHDGKLQDGTRNEVFSGIEAKTQLEKYLLGSGAHDREEALEYFLQSSAIRLEETLVDGKVKSFVMWGYNSNSEKFDIPITHTGLSAGPSTEEFEEFEEF